MRIMTGWFSAGDRRYKMNVKSPPQTPLSSPVSILFFILYIIFLLQRMMPVSFVIEELDAAGSHHSTFFIPFILYKYYIVLMVYFSNTIFNIIIK